MLYILILFAGGIFIMAERDKAEQDEALVCQTTINKCTGMCYDI